MQQLRFASPTSTQTTTYSSSNAVMRPHCEGKVPLMPVLPCMRLCSCECPFRVSDKATESHKPRVELRSTRNLSTSWMMNKLLLAIRATARTTYSTCNEFKAPNCEGNVPVKPPCASTSLCSRQTDIVSDFANGNQRKVWASTHITSKVWEGCCCASRSNRWTQSTHK
jgi:hypothetical protein